MKISRSSIILGTLLGFLCVGIQANSQLLIQMLQAARSGCYRNSNINPQFSAEPIHSEMMTAYWCVAHCKAYGYELAGVGDGRKCACGNALGDYEDLSASECGACPGDNGQSCGGNLANSVYYTDIFDELGDKPTEMYQQCATLASLGNIDPEDTSVTYTQLYGDSMTAETCISFCKFRNYNYAFLQEGERCHCRHTPGAASTDSCGGKCDGSRDDDVKCGSGDSVAQYYARVAEYALQVTSEGGSEGYSIEYDRHNRSYFSISGSWQNNFRSKMGINIMVVGRKSREVTAKKSFNALDDSADEAALVQFLKNIPDESVVLWSVKGDATHTCKKACLAQTRRLGSFTIPKQYDSWAFVGYKGSDCGIAPLFLREIQSHIQQRFLESAPATVTSSIPVVCFLPARNQDRTVKVASEGGVSEENFEYTPHNYETNQIDKALFDLDGNRVVSSTWERGLNVVAFDRDSRFTRVMVENFPTHSDAKAGTDFADFIDDLPDDYVVLVSAWGDGAKYCNDKCRKAIVALGGGSTAEFGENDSYALIGYKGDDCRDDGSDRAFFVAEALALAPDAQSNTEKEAEPVEVTSTIPRSCD